MHWAATGHSWAVRTQSELMTEAGGELVTRECFFDSDHLMGKEEICK